METIQSLIQRRSVPDLNTNCWLWVGSTNSWGYGRIGRDTGRRFGERLAHRLSYAAYVGVIPHGMNVLHRCDVPRCVNPEHLFIGTLSDNAQDCLAKGRHRALKGEMNRLAKLTHVAVADLRSRTRQHGSMTVWALEFGVSRRAIDLALRGATWSA